MFRVFETFLRRAEDPARCRRRRCIPSLLERASCLEDRVLLSAAGGKAHAAEVARGPADTRAGKEVINAFESILRTSPTGAQLAQLVHQLRDGMSVAALRRDLAAEAGAQPGTRAPMNVVIISGDPPAPATGTTVPAVGEATIPIGIMLGQLGTTGPNGAQVDVSQMPAGTRLAAGFGSSPAPTSGNGSPAEAPGTASPMPSMGGMGSSSGMAMSTMGSSSGMAMSTMGSSATAGSSSVFSAGIGTPAMLPISPMSVAPLSSTSAMM